MARVLVIADQQSPFEHRDYLDFLKEIRSKYLTDTTVHIGDEIDHHALGDYDHDPDGYSAGHELGAAIDKLTPYYRAFPKLKLCESNHTMRIIKRAFKSGIPIRYMKDFRDVIGAPRGWVWAPKWIIDDAVYKHGLGYSGTMGAINAAKDELRSCVIGHLHSDAGILYWSNGTKTMFGMNVGCGIDSNEYAFAYGKHCRKKPVLSAGIVLNGRPTLITMNLKNGRWDGLV